MHFQVEEGNYGKIVAIDIETGAFEVAEKITLLFVINYQLMSSSFDKYLAQSLNTIKRPNWYRQEKLITGLPGAIVEIQGQKLII